MNSQNRQTKPTRAEAIAKAGQTFAAGRRQAALMTPREQAEAAWTPTCGVTVDELEDEIRADRGLPALRREAHDTDQ